MNNIPTLAIVVFWSLAITEPAYAEVGKVFRDCPDCPEMVEIPGGNFDMGEKGSPFADPVHRVKIAQPFAIGKTEITQGQWQAIMGNNPSKFKQCGENCPVEEVSWDDAQLFIKILSAKTGQHYRLPSESEWEYACRAGKRQQYCGNDKAETVSWYGPVELPYKGNAMTHPVAGKQPNAFGLYDMSGNVWEWVEDTMHEDYKGAPTNGAAWLGGEQGYHMTRSGSWANDVQYSSAAFRHGMENSTTSYNLGFRVVRMLARVKENPATKDAVNIKAEADGLKRELNQYLAQLPKREQERDREETQDRKEMEAAESQAAKEQLKAEANSAFKQIKEKMDAMCANPEYRVYFAKTPCLVKDMKPEHLSDKSKITVEQKPVLVKAKKASAEINADFTNFQRTYNGESGKKGSDLYEKLAAPEYNKNSTALYEERISWGEFNQRRREIDNMLRSEIAKATQH